MQSTYKSVAETEELTVAAEYNPLEIDRSSLSF